MNVLDHLKRRCNLLAAERAAQPRSTVQHV